MLDDLRAVPWPTALALFAGGAAATAILLILVAGSGGGSAATLKRSVHPRIRTGGEAAAVRRRPKREAESPPTERVSVARMVGQRFMVGLRGMEPSSVLLGDVRRGEIGGVVLFPEGASPAATGAAVARLEHAAAAGGEPPLLIATDQEGGQVKRFPGGPPKKPLSALSAETALREGQATGIFLRRCGIDVDLAPVVDLGLPGSFIAEQGRTISANPNTVTRIALAFAGGLGQVRTMPVAKHFPGLGGALTNTDEGRSVVESGLSSSLKPYAALIGSGIPAIMLSTAIYTKLDPSHGAAWSGKVVGGLLRHRLGFHGLAISDDLSSHGVADTLPIPEAVTESARAGVDMLMVAEPEWFRPAYRAVLRAAEEGRVSERNLVSSYERILRAKERFGR